MQKFLQKTSAVWDLLKCSILTIKNFSNKTSSLIFSILFTSTLLTFYCFPTTVFRVNIDFLQLCLPHFLIACSFDINSMNTFVWKNLSIFINFYFLHWGLLWVSKLPNFFLSQMFRFISKEEFSCFVKITCFLGGLRAFFQQQHVLLTFNFMLKTCKLLKSYK